jgi:mannose-6-phosphate isomerase-like protein (cupin superfamily)
MGARMAPRRRAGQYNRAVSGSPASLVGLELDDGNVLLRFTATAAETAGALHAQEARYAPRSRPPPYHCHPRQDERFQIVEGALEFRLAGETRTVRAGEELAIGRGVYHHAHNPLDVPALVVWETRPALRSAELYRLLYAASRGRAKPPLAEAAAILREFRDELRLARPPRPIQRLVFGCFAPFGRAALRR